MTLTLVLTNILAMEPVIKALAEPNRRQILELIASRELSAGDVARHFSVSRSAVSQHLTVLRQAGLVEEHDFHDFKISVKHNDPVVMVRAYELLSERGDWPLHLGVTEAGTKWSGSLKSAVGLGTLLAGGIGDTIRISLSTFHAEEEVKVAWEILKALQLRERGPVLIACPTCGRLQFDMDSVVAEIERRERLANRVAVGAGGELDLRDAAAGEIDAVVEALGEQQHDRQEIDHGRQGDEEIAFADEIEIDVGTDEL